MQELQAITKERFDKVTTLLNGETSSTTFQNLKDEEKGRCQKQNWILSMIKAKRNFTLQQKNNFYGGSYQMMKIIDFQFTYELSNITEQTFLNDFISLFTRFFDNFQSKFSFKTKIKSILRPTNHNVINDLIKYLVQFSRDYFQQIFFWHTKISLKNQAEEGQTERERFIKESTEVQKISIQQREKPTPEEGDKRQEFQRLYGVLEIQQFPLFIFADKRKSHLDIIKLRINQMYREGKSRNNLVKLNIQDYYNNYYPNAATAPPKPSLIEDTSMNISFPFQIPIVIQKNGFSCLNVNLVEKKIVSKEERNLSPLKEKRYASFSVPKQQSSIPKNYYVGKKQLMLNSLKILRVSENFLPPLLLGIHENKLVEKKEKVDKKKETFSKTETVVEKEMMEQNKEVTYREGSRYYNEELRNESEKLVKEKKKIKDFRFKFSSQEKMKRRDRVSDPEEELIQWLEKINKMKQIEMKKIMGIK